ncbi:hypothetical protein DEU52_14111 [Ensifer adhaerens]|nr:hypothetical protein DEU52_14111 [Ensifer adhaerens]
MGVKRRDPALISTPALKIVIKSSLCPIAFNPLDWPPFFRNLNDWISLRPPALHHSQPKRPAIAHALA